jgi:hypothetical protein
LFEVPVRLRQPLASRTGCLRCHRLCDATATGAHLTILRVAAPKIRSSSVKSRGSAVGVVPAARCHAGTSSCICRAGRIAPRATDRPSPRQPSDIKVLYRFHQNNDASISEVAHTSSPIPPPRSPASNRERNHGTSTTYSRMYLRDVSCDGADHCGHGVGVPALFDIRRGLRSSGLL